MKKFLTSVFLALSFAATAREFNVPSYWVNRAGTRSADGLYVYAFHTVIGDVYKNRLGFPLVIAADGSMYITDENDTMLYYTYQHRWIAVNGDKPLPNVRKNL